MDLGEFLAFAFGRNGFGLKHGAPRGILLNRNVLGPRFLEVFPYLRCDQFLGLFAYLVFQDTRKCILINIIGPSA